MLNRTKEKAIGEALDISNALPKTSNFTIRGTDNYSNIKNAKIVIITASVGVYSKNRNELIQDQAKMIKDIGRKIKSNCRSPIVLIISNPVDVLTYYFIKETNFSRNRVLGIASSLDSSRFRYLISEKFGTKQSQIHGAYVLGEHGDSMVPIYSKVKIKGKNATKIISSKDKEEITIKTKNYWKTLRNYKSRSQFGISKNTFDIVESIIKKKSISIPTSVLLKGEYGEKDVCIGVPSTIGPQGLKEIQKMKLSNSELELFKESAETIRKNIALIKSSN